MASSNPPGPSDQTGWVIPGLADPVLPFSEYPKHVVFDKDVDLQKRKQELVKLVLQRDPGLSEQDLLRERIADWVFVGVRLRKLYTDPFFKYVYYYYHQ